MSELPEPPENWPKYLRENLHKQDPQRLRDIAAYAEQVAEAKVEPSEAELLEEAAIDSDEAPDGWDDDEWDEVLEEIYDSINIPYGEGIITDSRGIYHLKWYENGHLRSKRIPPGGPKQGDSD